MQSNAIKNIISGDVDTSKETLDSHSKDASLFQIEPEVVIYPKNTDDVQALVRYVAQEKKDDPNLSITARSAGTCMAGGSLNTSIILDTTRYLNHLGEVERTSSHPTRPHFFGATQVVTSGLVRIEPGVYYRDLEKATLAENLILPCFTASKSINALGGMIGNNSGGELSLKYGKTQDYIKSIDVVFSDGTLERVEEIPRQQAEYRASRGDFVGNIYKGVLELIDANRALIEAKRPHVSKNSAGYNIWDVSRMDSRTGNETIDLSQLIVGSQGTLGVTASAEIRLVDVPKYSNLLVVFIRDLKHLAEIVQTARSVSPETVEAYDDKTIKLALKFWFGFIKKRGLWGAIKLGLSFLPELGMLLTGMPKLVLLVECAGGNEEEIAARITLLEKKLSQFSELKTRRVKNKANAEKYWTIRRDSFALLREHFQGKRTAPFIDDVIVPPEKLPLFVPALREILEHHGLTYNIHGHAGNGNFHIIPLIDADARLSNQMILDVSGEVYKLVIGLGGSITAEHNDGIIRTPYLTDMFGKEMTDLFAKIKHLFDPQNIFNPGKKVGLSKEDIGKYLAH